MTENPKPFKLNPGDRQSAAWQSLKNHYTKRLALLRQQNDTDQDERKTARLRGQIAEVKALLELENEMPVIPGPLD